MRTYSKEGGLVMEPLSLEMFKNCHDVAVGVPVSVGRLDQMISRSLFQPQPFCD